MTRRLGIALLGLLFVACGGSKHPDPLAHCDQGLCGDGPLFAVSTAALVGSDGEGHSPGFHLSGGDTSYCPSSDLKDPETGALVDNQVANLIPVLEKYVGTALPTLIQNAVNSGGLFMLMEIVGDPTKDKTVDVVFHQGKGAPLLGADGLMLKDQTVEIIAQPPTGTCTNATVSNGVVSCGPFNIDMAISVFQNTYHLSFIETYMKAKLPTDNSAAQLLLGGAITVANIQAIADLAGPAAGDLTPVVQGVLPGLADIADPTTHQCYAISGALQMNAQPVFATTN